MAIAHLHAALEKAGFKPIFKTALSSESMEGYFELRNKAAVACFKISDGEETFPQFRGIQVYKVITSRGRFCAPRTTIAEVLADLGVKP